MTRMLITNARLFTAVDETVLDDAAVLVDGDTIDVGRPDRRMPPPRRRPPSGTTSAAGS